MKVFRRTLDKGTVDRVLAALAVLWVVAAAALLVLSLSGRAAAAEDEDFGAAVQALGEGGFRDKVAAIDTLVALGDPRGVAVLQAMARRQLFVWGETGRVVIGESAGRSQIRLIDPVTQEPVEMVAAHAVAPVAINNRLRRTLNAAIGQLRIYDPDPNARIAAAQELARDRSPATADLLRQALEQEEETRVRDALTHALAQTDLFGADRARRLEAIEALSGSLDPRVRALLSQVVRDNADPADPDADEAAAAAAQAALDRIETNLAWIDLGLNIFQGISLGSVLLLAAMGLAITFGVMGVINMAHGEMIMLGAYTTFVVQEIFRAAAPGMVDLYVLAAIPAAFMVAAAVGAGLEQGVIRFLYGRPLETLLATWGISLILQQIVRMIFGAPNREVANPDWMQGGFDLIGGAVITYNRLYIIVFALLVLAAVAAAMRYTRFGLQMRAVAQNRPMAAAMGIRSGRIDAMTFALGSGIAGVGGVALSQIGNVSPNLGQSYIVDSFMVVVFGGVGSLWGVLVAAMTLGIINKFLEPYAGAMLGKIIVLVFIILFIQRRPRGLFAPRGRAAEA